MPNDKQNQEFKETTNDYSFDKNEDTQRQNNLKYQLRTFPFVVDLQTWLKKNRLDPTTKVFIVIGGYSDIKKALLKRGWVQNPDNDSPCFHLKWALKAKDINHKTIQPFQIVNHYEKNTSITTKIGLTKNLRSLIWFNNVDINEFFPKCFDLNDPYDYQEFLEEFMVIKSESILKQYLNLIKMNKLDEAKKIEFKVKVAQNVNLRRIQDINDGIDGKIDFSNLVKKKEWQVLSQDDLNVEQLQQKKFQNWIDKINQKYNGSQQKVIQKKKKKKRIDNTCQESDQKSNNCQNILFSNNEKSFVGQTDQFTLTIKQCCKNLKQKFPQYNLNGSNNIWILKPAGYIKLIFFKTIKGLSRGRGIACFNNLVEIEDHIKSKENQWVIQKYIENPLLIFKRKFDIRQWILVTCWNPLKVWFYEDSYVRFTVEEYDCANLSNKFSHLCNNSINAYHQDFNKTKIEGSMWDSNQFTEYLKKIEGRDIFQEVIKPKLKQIVIWTLECVQDQVENRNNTVELYGYDFMVDQNYNVWLIEVNSSPSMDYSTDITKKLVKQVLEDTIKVIVDYNFASKKKKKNINTGAFTSIFNGSQIIEQPNQIGLNLILEGKNIQYKNINQNI